MPPSRRSRLALAGVAASEVPTQSSLAGYVDLRRHPQAEAGGCVTLERTETVTSPRRELLELAPAGATGLWLDDRPLAAVTGDLRAILGQGLRIEVALEPGQHRWRLAGCPERAGGGRFGFYLRRLDGTE